MKLVFYGGLDDEDNIRLNRASLDLVGRKSPKITFIPSCSYDAERDYRDFVEEFLSSSLKRYHLSRFLYFPIDNPYDPIMMREVLTSDLIHLGGGNTYYFLKYLRKTGLVGKLKKFVKNGGVLSGLSAGAILMTPNIDTAGFPAFDRDENEENLTNLTSLNLVPFEFFPHYKNSPRYDRELLKHSRKKVSPLYACSDGSGIVVNGQSLSFVGRCFCFYQGKKIPLTKKLSDVRGA